jgi:tRNA1Val (adenine37-N6)-methyltransferase
VGFQCQQFYLKDDRCAMKVSTDSLLLGAWVSLEGSKLMADFGCGCGILALMLAQRSPAESRIRAIERDQAAAQQAAENVAASPWPEKVQVVHQDIRSSGLESFDLVLSNPPYFPQSLASADSQRALARQGDQLSLPAWFDGMAAATKPAGQLAMVVPASQWQALERHSQQQGWFLARCCRVTTVAHKAAKLVLAQWQRETIATEQQQLVIQQHGRYTDQFRQLTGAFYLAGAVNAVPIPVYPERK